MLLVAEEVSGMVQRSAIFIWRAKTYSCNLDLLKKEGDYSSFQTAKNCNLSFLFPTSKMLQIRIRTAPLVFDSEGTRGYMMLNPEIDLYMLNASKQFELVSFVYYDVQAQYSSFDCKLVDGSHCNKQEADIWN